MEALPSSQPEKETFCGAVRQHGLATVLSWQDFCGDAPLLAYFWWLGEFGNKET